MGRIVINKTDAGQKVLLDTNEEGVTGGYFDSEEVWHEFGGGGETEDLLQTLEVTNNTNYNISIYSNRISTVDNKSVCNTTAVIRPSATSSLLFPFGANSVEGIIIATRVNLASSANVSMLSATLTVDGQVTSSTLIPTAQLDTANYKALYFFAHATRGNKTTLVFNYS